MFLPQGEVCIENWMVTPFQGRLSAERPYPAASRERARPLAALLVVIASELARVRTQETHEASSRDLACGAWRRMHGRWSRTPHPRAQGRIHAPSLVSDRAFSSRSRRRIHASNRGHSHPGSRARARPLSPQREATSKEGIILRGVANDGPSCGTRVLARSHASAHVPQVSRGNEQSSHAPTPRAPSICPIHRSGYRSGYRSGGTGERDGADRTKDWCRMPRSSGAGTRS
jgi:hypothetical protein